jgi:hypothetical protein
MQTQKNFITERLVPGKQFASLRTQRFVSVSNKSSGGQELFPILDPL